MTTPTLRLRHRSNRVTLVASVVVGVVGLVAILATGASLWAAAFAALHILIAWWHDKRAMEVAIDGDTFSWKRRGSWEHRPLTDVQQVEVSSLNGWHVRFPDRTVQLMLAGWRDQQGRRGDVDLSAVIRAIGGLDGQLTHPDPPRAGR